MNRWSFCRMYYYIFYKICRFNIIFSLGTERRPYVAGHQFLALLVAMNLISLLSLVSFIAHNSVILNNLKTTVVIVTCLFLIVNYYIFVYQNKYEKIIKMFENEKGKSRLLGTIFVWFVVVVTFAIVITPWSRVFGL